MLNHWARIGSAHKEKRHGASGGLGKHECVKCVKYGIGRLSNMDGNFGVLRM